MKASAAITVGSLLALAISGVAHAATPGSLVYTGCVSEPTAEQCGGVEGYGLEQPAGVAVSPDGQNVYVAGAGGGAVVVLNLASDGALTYASCLGGSDRGTDPQCGSSAGLVTPEAVAVSPDGHDVYVLDQGQIDIFARSSDGSLTSAGCVGDADEPSCAASAPGHTLYPYDYPGAIAVSADGDYVYTATDDGGGGNGAVDEFARAADGALTSLGCIAASGGTESDCGSSSPALVASSALAIGSDGYLYVGGENTVASFKIEGDGTLSPVGCIGTASGCTPDSDLSGAGNSPNSLAISPDGSTLYVSAHLTGAIVELASTRGTLSDRGCVGQGSSGCATAVPPLCGPEGLAVSGDGANVYALDGCSDTVTMFARAQDGALTYDGCIADTISSTSCLAIEPGLDSPVGIAISPDDSEVFITGQGRDSVAAFTRAANLAPEVSIVSPADGGAYTQSEKVKVSFTCTRAPGGAPIASCSGTVPSGGELDTTTSGKHTFTVTATDTTGRRTVQTADYSVVGLGSPGIVGLPGIPATGPGGAGAGVSRLTVSRFSQSRRRWTELRPAAGHAGRYGTRFMFTASRAGLVTLTFTKRVGRRTVTLGKLTIHVRRGKNVVLFYGRVSRRIRLSAGTYTVTLAASGTARAASGGRSKQLSLRFTIER